MLMAQQYANSAATSASTADTRANAAADSAKRAEDAAARAGEIVGGDFATKNELNAHAGDTTKHVTAAERTAWNAKLDASQKGTAGGVATLGSDGKVPTAQLPEMDYDAAGSAAAVQGNLDAHTANHQNPHGVTAEQVGARPASWMPTAADVGAAPVSHTHPVGQVTGVLPISKGGTGVSSLTGTDYTTVRVRGMAICASSATAPTIGNGCLLGVYDG